MRATIQWDRNNKYINLINNSRFTVSVRVCVCACVCGGCVHICVPKEMISVNVPGLNFRPVYTWRQRHRIFMSSEEMFMSSEMACMVTNVTLHT